MKDVVVIAAKGICGGLVVVVFALLGEVCEPKRFAGLFSAAPSVAVAGLTVTAVASGPDDLPAYATGMLVGTAAFAVYAVVNAGMLRRFGALVGSSLSFVVWFAVALPGYWMFLR